jgi:hypothetical protein
MPHPITSAHEAEVIIIRDTQGTTLEAAAKPLFLMVLALRLQNEPQLNPAPCDLLSCPLDGTFVTVIGDFQHSRSTLGSAVILGTEPLLCLQ